MEIQTDALIIFYFSLFFFLMFVTGIRVDTAKNRPKAALQSKNVSISDKSDGIEVSSSLDSIHLCARSQECKYSTAFIFPWILQLCYYSIQPPTDDSLHDDILWAIAASFSASLTPTSKLGADALAGGPSIVNKTGSDRVVWISEATTLAVEGGSGGVFSTFPHLQVRLEDSQVRTVNSPAVSSKEETRRTCRAIDKAISLGIRELFRLSCLIDERDSSDRCVGCGPLHMQPDFNKGPGLQVVLQKGPATTLSSFMRN
ncbi:hypothetical protein WN48_00784 [Eufriesea mexicana]|uniref:Uncharacterized protein n=1 Tax=Eufriesea mexicana TaxID=516756 RepID=A0A310SLN8_9HYME|nr:hypothetical protein WN48_00784 [Eufriesea mexicana]